MGVYLSKRKYVKDPEKIFLYAVENIWNKKTKSIKKEQKYLGFYLDGELTLDADRAIQYQEIFSGSPYEQSFRDWQQEHLRHQQRLKLAERIEDTHELNAGIYLLFGRIADQLNLNTLLSKVFGDRLSAKLLSLAYYCAAEGRHPLYRASDWSKDEMLPSKGPISEGQIAKILADISPSDIASFKSAWAKTFDRNELLSLDITSISSYCQHNPDVTFGYNRDKESLPQVNLLMIVGQQSKLPVWFDELPGAISDVTTIKDIVYILKKTGNAPRKLVLDRGFTSKGNIEALLKNHIKFTMGVPLHRFKCLEEKIKKASEDHLFDNPQGTLPLFEDDSVMQTQAISQIVKFDGHRVYAHIYYTEAYKASSNATIMSDLAVVTQKLQTGQVLTSEYQKHLASTCFTVTHNSKRGIVVRPNLEAISQLKANNSGFFAIFSSQFKDPNEALKFYKLRDGIEKSFDDLKNEEDCRRLRVHSLHNSQARLFIQFIAEILRSYILNKLQNKPEPLHRARTVNDVIWAVRSIRYAKVPGSRGIFKRPTKDQLELLDFFGIDTNNSQWPSLNKKLKHDSLHKKNSTIVIEKPK